LVKLRGGTVDDYLPVHPHGPDIFKTFRVVEVV
jgi:hypothetical protein